MLKINELITLMTQLAVITAINLTSNIHRRRYRLSVAKEAVILISTLRLMEKHGPVLLQKQETLSPSSTCKMNLL